MTWFNRKITALKNDGTRLHQSHSVYLLLTLGFITVAIIPLLILSYALWNSAWDNAWREVEEKHKLLAINLLSPLSIYVQDHQNSLDFIAYQISDSKKYNSPDEVKTTLKDINAYLSDFQTLFYVSVNGTLTYHTGKNPAQNVNATPLKNINSIQRMPCYQQAFQKKISGLSGVTLSLIDNKPTILLCEPVKNQNNKLVGVLVAELGIAPIEKIRRQIKFGNLGHSAMIDQYGKVIAHPNPNWMKEMKDISSWPIAKNMAQGKQGVLEFYSPFIGENMVAGYAGDTATGWGVMVPQPRSEIENQVYGIMQNLIVWGVIGLSIAIVFAIALARWITLPINQLARAAHDFKKAGFKGKIPNAAINAPHEVQQLTHTIQALSKGFNESKNEIQELNQTLEIKIDRATKVLKLANVHLEQIASVDDLTDLANRRHIQRELKHIHEQSMSSNKTFSILLCDLDRFKLVNDKFGHHIGDRVLKAFSQIAPRELREDDMIGRWGGEEFLCILKNSTPEEAFKTAERIRKTINQTLTFEDNQKVEMSVSIGVASYPLSGASIDLLLSSADSALYDAKKSGRNRVVSSIGSKQGVFTIAGLINDALENGQIHAAYQNIVDLQTNEIVAEETLARIIVDNEEIEAYRFIEAASQLQLTHKIDFELINHTITRMSQHQQQQKNRLQFINISTDLLRNPNLTHQLIDRLEQWTEQNNKTKAPVVIEITEREFLGNTDHALKLLKPFLDKEYLLAIDDFGSGYSSFQYLTDLPIAYLKIEGRLVSRALKEPKVRSILSAIQDTANELNVITLAECIENKETHELLKELGINLGQGHYFGRPEIDKS